LPPPLAQPVALPLRGTMANREREESPGRPARKPARSERLAAALRDNLRRRKAQARSREASCEPAPGSLGDRESPVTSPAAGGKRDC